jgi:hypothetical protein
MFAKPFVCRLLFALGTPAVLATAAWANPAQADADWPRWQARLGVATADASTSPSWSARLGAISVQSASLLGDWYFRVPGLDRWQQFGGFRATSGLIVGPRYALSSALAMPSRGSALALGHQQLSAVEAGRTQSAGLPYLGLGYSIAATGRNGLSFQADVGVLMQNPQQQLPRLGRALVSQARVDEVLRELRWSPLLTLGIQYSF